MKRIMTAIGLVLLLSSSALQAGETPVNQKLTDALNHEFSGVSNAHWEKVSGAYQTTFNYMGQRLIAYFSPDGELISTTRFINLNQLPFAVTRNLKEKYPDIQIQESVLEAVYDSQTFYFITATDQKKEYILKASASEGIFIVNKRKLKQ